MDATLDLSRWRERPLGVMHRRRAIVAAGMRQLLRTRFFRILLMLAWAAGLGMAVAGFLFTQSIASGGWLESFAAGQSPRVQAVVAAFTAIVLLYPDICIGGLFSALFWLHSHIGLLLSLIALSAVVPHLITRDRASHALDIYLARPLTSLDYLLGKLGVIVGILLLVWTGPLLFGWVVSMAVAPEGDFLRYSLEPLGRALLFNLVGLVALASIALGVSSLTRSSRATVLLWIGVWILALAVANFPTTPEWMRGVSFSRNLDVLRGPIFQLETIFTAAAAELPISNREITTGFSRFAAEQRTDGVASALGGLVVLVTASLVVLVRRLRPS